MKRVLVFGTFDKLHPGHLDFFRQAKEFGELVVVVARDETVKAVKGKYPVQTEQERLAAVQQHAHKAVLGYLGDKYRVIEEQKPDVICLGFDQDSFTEHLENELNARNIPATIYRLESFHPETYKSSKL